MGLDGRWYNELGSSMVLHLGSDGRSLTGTYHSAVGQAVEQYDFVGRLDSDPRASTGLGWTVSWENEKLNAHSVTTWSGQYRVVDGDEFIATTWLLTREGTADDEWESTLVGKDLFSRNPPAQAHVARTRALRGLPPVG
jgi:avidin family protein